MADGMVKITIEADGNKAIKSAKDLQAVFGQLGKGGQTSGLTEGLDDVSKHSNSAKTSILDMVTAMGLVKVAGMAFNAVKDNIGSIINEGAKLQQSLGGVETLFKSSAGTVKKYADQAFKTAGLSANEYMENVTSFSASLISSMGGDTAKAAEVANMAMVDMSDNANKMGTNIGDIQNAYQGFAKQNYTMLDNLKLGYGGTQEEMKRLLADATKISHVKYDINNLSDVYNAIHVIQKNLDITGTTAKEAASTFSGSFDSMAAAAKNVAGRIALGMDIKPALNDLAKTMSTFIFGNFIPMITNIFKALPSAIAQFAGAAVPKIAAVGRQIENILGVSFEAIPANFGIMFDNLFSDVNFSKVVQGLSVIVGPIQKVLQGVLNLVNGAVIGISFALEGIKAAMAKVFDGSGVQSFGATLNSIADSIFDSLTVVEAALMTAGQTLASLNWVAILTGVKVVVGALMGTVKELADIISAAFSNDIFKGLVVGILSAFAAFKTFAAVSAIVTSVATKVTALIGVIKNVGAGISILFNAIKSGKEIVAAFNLVLGVNPFVLLGVAIAAVVAGLVYFFAKTQSGQKIWANFTKFLSDAWNSLKDIASNTWAAIVNTFTGAADGVKSGWSSIATFFSNLWNGIVTSSTAAWSGFTQALSAIWQGTVMVAQTVWGGISAFFIGLWNNIVSVATNVWNIFGASLTTIWQGIVTVAQGVWEMLKAVILGPILILIDLLTGNWKQLGADLQLIWSNIVAAASTIWNGLVTYFTGILSFIVTYFSTVWNDISATAIAIWNGIVNTGQAIWNGFVSALSAIWSGLVNSAIAFWNALKNGTISIFNGIVNGSVAIWNGLVSGVTSLVSGLVSGVVSMWNSLKSSVVSIANGIKDGAINAWNGMVSGVRGIISSVRSTFNSLRDINLFSIGKHIVQGLIDGIGGMIGNVRDKISELASTVTNGIRKALKIHSPSRVMAELGMYTGMGFSNGIEGMIPTAEKMSKKLAEAAMIKKTFGVNSEFAGITAESATGIGRGVTPTNSVVNNYSNTATTTVQTAKESNDKVLEALNKIANNRPVAVVDGSSFAPAYEPYGSTETARRSQMKGRGLAVDSKF